MLALTPAIVVSVSLTGSARGWINFVNSSDSLMLSLVPFGKGNKGDKGDTGDAASLSADAGNDLTLGLDGGIFYRGSTLDTQDW